VFAFRRNTARIATVTIQRENASVCALRHAQKLLVGLGRDGDLNQVHYLSNPKWMGRKTVRKRMEQSRAATRCSGRAHA
jgi:hypothetical protein